MIGFVNRRLEAASVAHCAGTGELLDSDVLPVIATVLDALMTALAAEL